MWYEAVPDSHDSLRLTFDVLPIPLLPLTFVPKEHYKRNVFRVPRPDDAADEPATES